MSHTISFWFSIGSTYTYLTVMRIGAAAEQAGIAVTWRPFSVRQLMVEQNNVPFRDKPVKAAYMWRDVERRAQMHGLPIKVPAPYPLSEWDITNQVAVLAAREGWCEAYAREAYRRWFQLGQEPGVEPTVAETLAAIGQDAARVITDATSDETVTAYRAATDEARALRLFGSPSFIARGEVFWGDDRLENAMDWARYGTLAATAP